MLKIGAIIKHKFPVKQKSRPGVGVDKKGGGVDGVYSGEWRGGFYFVLRDTGFAWNLALGAWNADRREAWTGPRPD